MPAPPSKEPSEGPPEESTDELCENCARPDADLVVVQRIYLMPVDPATNDGVGGVVQEVLDDLERWCFSCRSQYPHREVDVADD